MQYKFSNEDFSCLLTNNGEVLLRYLFDKYYDELCRLSFRYTGRSDVAEDMVQEVFINIWNKRHSLNYQGKIKPYLIRSVINSSLNHIKSKHEKHIFEDDKILAIFDANPGYHEDLNTKELEKLLETAIGKLPDKCREIFVLSRLSELSHKEIAEELDISTKTIEAQITIALKKIRQFLSQVGYFPFFLLFLKNL
jgi:RNA polymerase sigma-70 factor, ECF subfamily